MPGTPVVDVLFFLNVAGKQATVIAALHEPTEGNHPLRIPWPVVTEKNRLHLLKKRPINEQWMRTGISLPTPLEKTDVKPVF